jgi:hypothetical protein
MATDLAKIDRTIAKEPAYETKHRKYCLLVLGPEAKIRIWLVLDGHTLYVDRNGNGDLTEPGEKVVGKKTNENDADDGGHTFEIGDLHVGSRVYKGVTIIAMDLKGQGTLSQSPDGKAALRRDAKAFTYFVSMYVEMPGYVGKGEGGRVLQAVNTDDASGLLQFSDRPEEAPILHFGGSWQITLSRPPVLRCGQEAEWFLGFGTPGLGKGTFAFVAYEGVVPARMFPKVDLVFESQKKGEPSIQAQYELKGRC